MPSRHAAGPRDRTKLAPKASPPRGGIAIAMPTRKLVPQDPATLQHSDLVVDLASGAQVLGEGPNDYICPHCRAKLLIGAPMHARSNTVLRCPSCRGYSRLERRSRVRARATPAPL